MKSARCFVVFWTFLLLVGLAGTASSAPTLAPGPKDRCPVCGMFVAPYPSWVAIIEFRDGSRAFFDGPKDMFVFFFDLAKYRPQAKPEDITGIHVTEYYTTRLLEAKDVFFVTGSDVMGPMGNELVPIGGRENAETFRRDHGGTKIMQFDGKNLIELSAPQ
ncbi:MAG TPA: nitrous oxide reductase accessory protein NosL [Desulfuromonadales bacterium]